MMSVQSANHGESAPANPESAGTPRDFSALGVAPQLVTALRAMRIGMPTRPQRVCIPPALAGRDVAVVAATGTGKTLAYLIPVAQRLLQQPPPKKRGQRVDPRRRLRALVLCPTRELAQQVAAEAALLLRGGVLRTGAVFGKSALGPQRALVRGGIDLLVGTPGRVRELCEEDSISLAFVSVAVMDEADRMLDMGFLPQATEILSRAPSDRQLLLLSATIPRQVELQVQEMMRNPVRIDLSRGAPAKVTGTPQPRHDFGHHVIDLEDEIKTAVTVALIKGEHRRGVIVFCRTRRRAGWVAAAMRKHSVTTSLLHGDRSQRQRNAALDEFAQGRAAVLVATDVAARGLHLPVVKTVVNYDVPLMPEDYVHRAGRAGHGGGNAETITLRSPADLERWERVEKMARIEPVLQPPPNYREFMLKREALAPDTERPAPKHGKTRGTELAKEREASKRIRFDTRMGARARAAHQPPGQGGARAGTQSGTGASGGSAQRAGGAKRGKGGKGRRIKQSRQPIAKGQSPGGGVRKTK